VEDGYTHLNAASPPRRRDPQLPAIVTDGMELLRSGRGGRASSQTQDDSSPYNYENWKAWAQREPSRLYSFES